MAAGLKSGQGLLLSRPFRQEEGLMIPVTYIGSRPDQWSVPRWRTDPCERRRIYGPIQPMEQEHGLIARLFERLTR